MAQPLLYVVVLNNNNRDDTLACLASLYRSDYQNFHVILLDYGSPESTIDAVRAAYREVQIVSLAINLGYAGNNNVGIRMALEQGAQWIFILNNDTVVDPSCLSRLVEFGVSDLQVGMVGPMVYHFDEPDVIQSAGGELGKYWRSFHLGMNETDQEQLRQSEQWTGFQAARSLFEVLWLNRQERWTPTTFFIGRRPSGVFGQAGQGGKSFISLMPNFGIKV